MRLKNRCFPMNTAKFLRAPVLKNICERLLLIEGFLFIWQVKYIIHVEKPYFLMIQYAFQEPLIAKAK